LLTPKELENFDELINQQRNQNIANLDTNAAATNNTQHQIHPLLTRKL